jgi:hypothetical protein
MSLITDMLLPAGFGAAMVALIFFARGLFAAVYGVPLWILAIAAVVVGTLLFIPVSIVANFYKNGREGFVFMQCRKEGIPCICDVEIGTGNAEFIAGIKDDPKSPVFKDEQSGLKVDPSLISAFAEPLRFSGGLNVIGYGHHNWLPQTHKNHLAFKAIEDYFNPDIENRPWMRMTKAEKEELCCFSIHEKIELISKAEHFLEADTKSKLGKYFKTARDQAGNPMLDEAGNQIYYRPFSGKGGEPLVQHDVTVPNMIGLIRKARSDIEELPIATGYYSMKEAFVNNNTPYSAQHLLNLKNLLRQLADAQWMKMMNWMQYGIIICAIIATLVIGAYILHSVVFV